MPVVTTHKIQSSFLLGKFIEYLMTEGSGFELFNSVNGAHVPKLNIVGLPEQSFNGFSGGGTVWQIGGGGTVTENFAANPVDGAITASRYVVTAGTKFLNQPMAVPAAQYTLSLWVKSNTGVSQTCRLGIAAGGDQLSVDKTVTTSWSRITFTVTTGAISSNVYLPRTDVAGTALDILIYGPQFEPGAAATAYIPANWNAQIGYQLIASAGAPTWSSDTLDFSGSTGTVVMANNEATKTLSAVSMYVVARWPLGGSPSVAPLINDFYSTSRLGMSAVQFTSQPIFAFSGTQTTAQEAQLHDNIWHIITGVYDGVTMRLYVDNMEVSSTVAGLTPIIVQQFILGNNNSFIQGWPGKIAYATVCDSGHNATSVVSNQLGIAALVSGKGITIDNSVTSRFYVAEGDSITDFAAFAANGYFFLSATGTAEIVQGRDLAIPGSKMATLTARAPQVDALYNADRKANILSVLMGANDLDGTITAAQFVDELKTYCLARKAVGWKIIVIMTLPHTTAGNPNFETQRAAVIALILADPTFYDALGRTDLDPDIGCGTCWTNPTYFPDGVHPSLAAQPIIASYVIPAIEAIY